MKSQGLLGAIVLALAIFFGLFALGFIAGKSAIEVKEYERTVRVKGLSERELPSDTIVWPIAFSTANNDLQALYNSVEGKTKKIIKFLTDNGISPTDISTSSPRVIDKSAQQWSGGQRAEFRYTAEASVTVYSSQVEKARSLMGKLSQLGREGIVFSADNYQNRPQYIFSGLNDLKPEMIEEATKNAREVALKFAQDSNSELGKIKRASQGQFSISARDQNNPQIKKIRVVSTIEYYLSD